MTNRIIADQYTLGRSIYVSGGTLDQCSTPAERSGFVGAEADDRRTWQFFPGQQAALLARINVLETWSAEAEGWGA